MTEVEDATERKLKWIRRIARILAVIWASLWTLVIGAFLSLLVLMCVFDVAQPLGECVAGVSIVFPPVVFLLWVPFAIAWRWDRVGGVVLVLQGFVVHIGTAILVILTVAQGLEASISKYAQALIVAIPIALPPWVLGILFLAGWWKSRTSEVRQGSEGGR
jgi:ABC-type molybdate transport system permease subunit